VGTNALVLSDELKAEPAVACCRPEGEQAAAWADNREAIAAEEAIVAEREAGSFTDCSQTAESCQCRLKEANVMQTNAGRLLNAT
jgi:hypothetical protein